MFDSNISALINGVEIDTPKNALSLAKSIHPAFGAFEIYFDFIKVAMPTESLAMIKLSLMPMDSHGM